MSIETGSGAFTVLLIVTIPLMVAYVLVVIPMFRRRGGVSSKKVVFVEALWLALVASTWIAINTVSLSWVPQHKQYESPGVQTLNVEAFMWGYNVSSTRLRAGVPVEITAKSLDTVHSFAVYSPEGDLLFTIMLMPGRTERLTFVFEEPGRYLVRCLEYCGDGHAFMLMYLEVG